jgi:hypothetical protein
MTKAITSTAAMPLVEQDRFAIEESLPQSTAHAQADPAFQCHAVTLCTSFTSVNAMPGLCWPV